MRDGAPPVHVVVDGAGEGFFEILGLPMTLGSSFTHEQQTPLPRGPGQAQGPPPVLIVSHHAWTELFGSDPQIVGKTIRFAEFTGTVVGVASRDVDLPHGVHFWINGRLDPQDVGHGLNAILASRGERRCPACGASWRS